MDLEENIRIAAEVFSDNQKLYESKSDLRIGFRSGATSQASKDYWYNEFKREQMDKHNKPLRPFEGYHNGNKVMFGDGSDDNWQKQVVEPGYEEQRQYQQYLKDNPDRPMSFDDWKYMVEHCNKITPEIIEEVMKDIKLHYFMNEDGTYTLCNSDGTAKAIVNGNFIKNFDTQLKKRIGIIGHVDHGKSITGKIIIVGKTGVDDRIVASAHNIQSIVPIADVIPEKIQLTSFYDKISVPKEWDTRKQKKVSHKRNNKRK